MKPVDLRAARKALGLTQKGLGRALHMGEHSWQTISAWENGKKPIPADLHLKMAGLAVIRKPDVNGKRKGGAD